MSTPDRNLSRSIRTMLTRRPDLAISQRRAATEGAAWCTPRHATIMEISSPAAVEALANGLGVMLHLIHTPMPDTVARLDTSHDRWVLYLDSDSPPEDLCWAMLDVLDVLLHGRHATTHARPVRSLRLVN